MKILELIFTNISLQAYTILSTILFTTLFYLVIIFLVKFYSTDSDNEENKKGTHVIIKIFILLFSIVAIFENNSNCYLQLQLLHRVL